MTLPLVHPPNEYSGQWGIPDSWQVISTGIKVKRAASALPQTDVLSLFSVSGRIKLIDIYGLVEVIIGAVANDTKLTVNPTVGANVDICAVLDINGLAVGTVLGITGTLATALQSNASGVLVYQAAGLVIPAGEIILDCAGSDLGGGRVSWILHYLPLDGLATVEAV